MILFNDIVRRHAAALLILAGSAFFAPSAAIADDEASNVAHIAAGPYGRCYAKSIPAQVYDREDEARQQGVTNIYRVENSQDVLIETYDWFAQTIFLQCWGGSTPEIVRIGPWHRGHDPKPDHLALAFYKNGELINEYSTLEIAGGEMTDKPAFSRYKNVSASVSHYSVFKGQPELVKIINKDGNNYKEEWVVKAKTVDGRDLVFDLKSGEIRKK